MQVKYGVDKSLGSPECLRDTIELRPGWKWVCSHALEFAWTITQWPHCIVGRECGCQYFCVYGCLAVLYQDLSGIGQSLAILLWKKYEC